MLRNPRHHWPLSVLLGFMLCVTFVATTSANHWWNGYHWLAMSTPFSLDVGDNVGAAWDPMLTGAVSDWSASNILDLSIVPSSGDPLVCNPVSGRIEVCSGDYGNTGWLGLTQVFENNSTSHVDMARTMLNDHTLGPNADSLRRDSMCQEIGHALGLDHQDLVFTNNNLGTCMDYTDDSTGVTRGGLNNEHPNAHDFSELSFIYSHNHSASSSSSSSSAPSSAGSSGSSGSSGSTGSSGSSGSTGSSGSANSTCSAGIPTSGCYIAICASGEPPTTCTSISSYVDTGCHTGLGACVPSSVTDCPSYYNNAIWSIALRCWEKSGVKACFYGSRAVYGWTPCS